MLPWNKPEFTRAATVATVILPLAPLTEPDGRFTLPIDAVLDELGQQYWARNGALLAIGELIVDHPDLESGLNEVVAWLSRSTR